MMELEIPTGHYSAIPKHNSVRFPASPRTHRRENEVNDQREENEHHQVKKFSFAYHYCLLGITEEGAKYVPAGIN